MAKEFFRWLRGELNGYYITRINNTLNVTSKEIKDFMKDFKAMRMELGKIHDKYLYGLGKFAGIFLPRMSREESIASIQMTESYAENGEEYSERGLFETSSETFKFYPNESGDINSLATPELRSSLVGNENIIGYISEYETNVLNGNGLVRREKVSSTPPATGAYSDYYGDNFLFLQEATLTYSDLSPELYIELFKCLQWIRYNGVSLESLVKVVKLVCPDGLVKLDKIEVAYDNRHYNIFYKYDDNAGVLLKKQRLDLLQYIIGLKFPQINLVETV